MEAKYFENGIIEGDLHSMLTLHPGTDQNEWMAAQSRNTVAELTRCVDTDYWFCLCLALSFFNHFNLLYGAISELCTTTSCPVMSAGSL